MVNEQTNDMNILLLVCDRKFRAGDDLQRQCMVAGSLYGFINAGNRVVIRQCDGAQSLIGSTYHHLGGRTGAIGSI